MPFPTVAEEGEAIGTLRQFALRLDLSLPIVSHTLETEARESVIFQAGPDPDRLLILDACGFRALLSLSQSTR